ncbi:MAG: ammonium transporter, partial [Sphingopyxis sp.]
FDAVSEFPLSAWIGGFNNAMLNNMGTVRDGTTVAETAFALSQIGFVYLAMALLSGMLAHRARLGWLLGFAGLWLLLVLAPVTRWLWGGGWLFEMGALDVAGGLTIFYATAISALVALMLIGKPAGTVDEPAHGPTRLAGAALLTIGMATLGSGATLGAGDGAAVAMLGTIMAAMVGALTMAALRRAITADALAAGLLAGTVAMACAADSLSFGGAMLLGALAAGAVALSTRIATALLPARIATHDSGASLVGMATAAKTGALLFAIFVSDYWFGGGGYAEGLSMGGQLIAQFAAVLTVAAWAIIGTLIAGLTISLVVRMRDDGAA